MNSSNDILKNFTVLCVEDDTDIREELGQFLKRRVHQLHLACDGAEGLALFKAHTPDLVITDILMPNMNGLDMSRAIKNLNPEVPIIVITAFNEPDFFLRAIDVGITKYVLKPIEMRKFIASLSEVAWLLRAQRELRISATVFDASAEAIVITDSKNRIITVNPAFSLITGYTHDEVVGKDPKLLNSGRHDADFFAAMWVELIQNHKWQGEIWNRRKNGEIYPEWLTISLVTDETNHPIYHIAIFSDMTARKAIEQRLYDLAHFDSLTHLPNRTLLADRLHQAIAQAERNNKQLALLFIDLDRFKYVNDTFGHLIGDLLLQEVSLRLKSCVRSSDTISRLGGDEFVVLLPEISDSKGAAKVAKQIIKQLTSTFILKDNQIHIGGSVGIALYPDNGGDAETLMKSADSAMYAVKESGRNNFQFFQKEMNQRLHERLAIENTFVAALNKNEFQLLYHPTFDANANIISVEALLRWHQANGRVLMPSEFLDLAEETGFILPLGKWVLATAITKIKSLHTLTNQKNLKLAINLSARQLNAPDFYDYIITLLTENAFDPACLEFEIPEKILLNASQKIFTLLNQFHDLGIAIVVDGFGAGYASLLDLSILPIKRLKVDRSLIANAKASDQVKMSLIYSIVDMAKSLSLSITMGGLETNEQTDLVKTCANLQMQGFRLCQPLTAVELEEQLGFHGTH